MSQFDSSSPEFCTLVELLHERALQKPEHYAYTFLLDGDAEESHLTYAELDSQARSIAALLQRYLNPGDPALLFYPPGLEYIAAFFGCLYAGVVAVPAYPPQLSRSLSRIQSIAADVQATVALTTRQTLALVEHRLTQIPDLQGLQWLATDELAGNLADNWQEPDLHQDSLAFLQYTSGSTATPKGVMLTHGNLLHNSALIHRCFEHNSNSRGVIWLPPYHDMGLIGGILQPLYGGFPVTLMSPIAFLQRPFRWLQAISHYRATTSGGPNFAYDLCVQKITPEQRSTLDLSSWEVAFNGAEPIRHETLERFTEAFAPCGFRREAFYPCYGLAEATLLVSGGKKANPFVMQSFQADALGKNRVIVTSDATAATNLEINLETPLDTSSNTTSETIVPCRTLIGCGQTLFNQKIAIVNPETMRPCLPDQVGEIWVSGDSVAQGYWNKPEQTDQTFQAILPDRPEVFLRTGDLGFFHAGELFVTGRLKDLIIIRGRNHYPQDIEQTVEHCHPALQPASGAAFSVEIDGEERLIVVQEVKRRYVRHLNEEEVTIAIRQAVAEQHELQVYGVLLLKTSSIPKTSSGKIQRHACRAGFLNGSLDSVSHSILTESVESSKFAESAAFNVTPSSEHLTRDALLALSQTERQSCLTDYLQRQMAQALKLNLHSRSSHLNLHQPLNSFGLDSLMVIELRHEIETRLGVLLPMERFFQDVTLTQLAIDILTQINEIEQRNERENQHSNEYLAEHLKDGTLIPDQTNTTEFALSYGQRSLWFLHQLAPNSPAYNIAIAVRIRTTIDIDALKRAFLTLLERHPALRTTFTVSHTEPYQQVQTQVQDYWQQQDASTWSEAFLNQQLIGTAHAPFNLEQGPLLRINLFTRSNQDQVLLLTAHHIVTDLWSMAMLTHELGGLYQAEHTGTPAHLPPLATQYGDYVRWQTNHLASSNGERLWSYWQQQLAGELPVLNLPTDRPRPLVQTDRGASHSFKLGAELTRSLKSLGRAHGATLYMTLLAAFQVLLHRYTGQDDLLVGSPTTGRSRADWAGLVGYFVNPVVLRSNLSGNPTFEAFLQQVRQTVLDAFEHQDYPLSLLVERLQPNRDPSRSPLFQTMFVWQKAHLLHEAGLTAFALGETGARMQWGDLELESVALEQRIAQFDLTLTMAEADAELIASLEYNIDLFEADTIVRMAGHLQTLLAGIVANPNQSLSKLPLLTEAEHHQLLVEFNQHSLQYSFQNLLKNQFWNPIQNTVDAHDSNSNITHNITPCIHSLFEAQVERTPDAIAVSLEQDQLSYRELNNRSNQLAHYLRWLGVTPDTCVGICMERSLEAVIGILGVLKAGGAYVPLDPDYPTERLVFMLEETQVTIVLTQQKLATRLSRSTAQSIVLDTDWNSIAQHGSVNLFKNESENNFENLSESATPANLAYVIYTSGSTGQPKGVMISHQSIVNRLLWGIHHYSLTVADRVLQKTSFNFDVSLWEVFGTLLSGAHLVMAKPGGHQDPAYLVQIMAAQQITIVDVVPAMLRLILEQPDLEACTALRYITCGGDALPSEVRDRCLARLNTVKLHNCYGPTEASIDATVWECDRHSTITSIGRPIANQFVYILDNELQPVPIGVPGELYIGGIGLAQGYLNRPALTTERFIPNPYSNLSSCDRLYKTGDLARYQPDGNIQFLGRVDDQVKVRGFRIELGEIEAVLRQHPAVQDTAVLIRLHPLGDQRLVAYIVPTVIHPTTAATVESENQDSSQNASHPHTLTSSELRHFLKQHMPEYMVPTAFVMLDALPLSPNGKLDRQSLPDPDWTRVELDVAFAAPRSAVEAVLAGMWAEVLGLETVGIYDNFFELGGHSLLATQVVSRIRNLFRVELPLYKLFEATTVAELSQVVITYEAKPGQFEKVAQVFQKIEQIQHKVGSMSAEAVREALQQKQQERNGVRNSEGKSVRRNERKNEQSNV